MITDKTLMDPDKAEMVLTEIVNDTELYGRWQANASYILNDKSHSFSSVEKQHYLMAKTLLDDAMSILFGLDREGRQIEMDKKVGPYGRAEKFMKICNDILFRCKKPDFESGGALDVDDIDEKLARLEKVVDVE